MAQGPQYGQMVQGFQQGQSVGPGPQWVQMAPGGQMGPVVMMGQGAQYGQMTQGPVAGQGMPNSNEPLWKGTMPSRDICFGVCDCNKTEYLITSKKLEETRTTTYCGMCAKKNSLSVQAINISEVNSREARKCLCVFDS